MPRVHLKPMQLMLLVIVLVVIVVAVFMSYRYAMTIVHPARVPVTVLPSSVGIEQWYNARFKTSDDLNLYGWYIPPPPIDRGEGKIEKGATVVLVHGLGANRVNLLEHAAILIEHGYGVLLFDLRNHGESDGTITTLGYLEPEDVLAALRYLREQAEVNPDRIVLFGQSMGGAAVIRAAAQVATGEADALTPDARAIIDESTFSTLEENIAQGVQTFTGLPSFPFAPMILLFGQLEVGVSIAQVRPIEQLADLSPRPILILHGEQDRLIDADNADRLYTAAGEPKELVLFPSAAHAETLENNAELWQRRVIGFLDRYARDA